MASGEQRVATEADGQVENVLVLFNERMGAMEGALRNVLARLDAATARSEPGLGAGPGAWSGGGDTAETEKDLEVFACLRYRGNRTEAEAEAHGDE